MLDVVQIDFFSLFTNVVVVDIVISSLQMYLLDVILMAFCYL